MAEERDQVTLGTLLTDEQRAKLEAHLDGKWSNATRCPVCGRDDKWGTGDRLWHVKEAAIPIAVDGPRMPLAAVICNNCGYTFFMNALLCGLVTEEPPD